jgi:3-oxoacyl-[acyl-carrier protein] reductase
MRLAGKSAIVTGAAQGIGLAITEQLVDEGASVLMADIQREKVQLSASRLTVAGVSPVGLGVDVTSSAQVDEMVKVALREFGKIDILVNNAGGSGTIGVADVEEVSEDLWDQIVDVNLKGTFICSRGVVPHMERRREGRIINISSGIWRGNYGPLNTVGARLPYSAAKAGVLGFTYQLAKDLGAWNITVNVIIPGFVLTEEGARVRKQYEELSDSGRHALSADVPLGRPGQPGEIARVVVFLASDDSSYVSGATLEVNGGG